jgi:hypothetical protein
MGKKIEVCSEIHTKHINTAESYYRLRSYRAENTVVSIYVSWHLVAVYGTPAFSWFFCHVAAVHGTPSVT